MNQRKAQHNIWDHELTVYLTWIVMCEICGLRKAVDKAHRIKRRFIGWRTALDKLEYFMAAKLCRPCHRALDEATGPDTHENMWTTITRIVLGRVAIILNGPRVPPHPQIEWDPVYLYNYKRENGFDAAVTIGIDRAKGKDRTVIMIEGPEGYRRTSIKTRDAAKLKEKLEMLHAQGEVTKVVEIGGYHIVYVKIEKEL